MTPLYRSGPRRKSAASCNFSYSICLVAGHSCVKAMSADLASDLRANLCAREYHPTSRAVSPSHTQRMTFPESPEAFGAALKAERLQQGLSLAAISQATKITESHFVALER